MTTQQIPSGYYSNVQMSTVYFAFIIGLMILVSSCTRTTSKLQLDPIQVEKELRAFETTHREAIDSKDIDGILKCYSTDLITISPDEPILYGKDWIRTLVTDLYKTYDFHEDFKLIDIRIIEEHVVASYSFSQQMTLLTGGEPTVQTGKGMCILNQ